MSLLAEYELRYDRLPLLDAAAAVPDVTLHVDVGQPNEDGAPAVVVHAAGDSLDALERAFDRSAFVADWSAMGDAGGTRRYQITPTRGRIDQLDVDDPDRFRSLADHRSVVERITVTPEGWIQERWFADREAFDEYRDFWRSQGASFSLRRLTVAGEGPEPAGSPDDGLTEAQREAVRVAHDLGYFEVPRRAELDEVAAELGVSAAACSERLRRAQASLVESVVDDPARKKALTR